MLFPDIPHYKIKETISHNPPSMICRAYHMPSGRDIALKIITADSGNLHKDRVQKNTVQRFLAEARISANLQHNHIIKIYDTGKHENFCYFSMEYLPQGSLREQLEQVNLPTLRWSIDIILQVASALSYTHTRGYIHRAIKPENILFRDANHAVLSDFGISRRKNQNQVTQQQPVQEPSHYLAPEQVLEQQTDARSDIYSLGVVFYELVTGLQPYPAGEHALDDSRYEAISLNLRKGLEPFEPVFNKLLARNPEHRFQSVDALTEKLQQIRLLYDDVAVEEVRQASPAKQIPHKHKPIVPIISLLLFLVPGFSIHSLPVGIIPTLMPEKTPEVVSETVTLKKRILSSPPLSPVIRPTVKTELIAVPPVTLSRPITPQTKKPRSTNRTTIEPMLREVHNFKASINTTINTSVELPAVIPAQPPPLMPLINSHQERKPDLNCILKLKDCNHQNAEKNHPHIN